MQLEILRKKAKISKCENYRYWLERSWGEGKTVLFIGLNPSTADATRDDPTIRRCVGFARDWGYHRLVMANLFAFRSKDPRKLIEESDPIGPLNQHYLTLAIQQSDLVVAAWGAKGTFLDQDKAVLEMIEMPHCLGTTSAGMPRHPLYMPSKCRPTLLN